jgi:hypothetical protein
MTVDKNVKYNFKLKAKNMNEFKMKISIYNTIQYEIY